LTSTLPTMMTTAAGSTIDTNSLNATLSGTISGPGGLTKIGAGQLTIRALLNDGAVQVDAGTLAVAAGGDDLHASRVGSVAVGAARLDLNENDLIATGSSVATMQAMINSARNSGAWDGNGITSSAARTHPQQATTLGVLSGSEYIGVAGTSFDGFTVVSTDTLAKYTWYGDTDFNGSVDFDDYVRTDGGFNGGLTGWLNGDFDGSGSVDFDDYVLIDLGFNAQSGTLRRAMSYLDGGDRSSRGMDDPSLRFVEQHFARFGATYASSFLRSVPEPASAGAFGAMALGALTNRRRRLPRAGGWRVP
jgi:hypothetical protein